MKVNPSYQGLKLPLSNFPRVGRGCVDHPVAEDGWS
jgi:hypothetical protein